MSSTILDRRRGPGGHICLKGERGIMLNYCWFQIFSIPRIIEYKARDQVYLETDQPMKPGKTYSIRSDDIQGYPQRIRLQRRLYKIKFYSVFVLTLSWLLLCIKLIFLSLKSSNIHTIKILYLKQKTKNKIVRPSIKRDSGCSLSLILFV